MANSFTRPPRVVGGNKQTISAKDFNALSRAIEELQNTISPSSPKSKRRNNAQLDPFWTTISQVEGSDPATYEVSVTLGYLSYQSNTPAAQASDLGTTGWIVPTIAGVSMESPIPQTDPPTEIPKLPLPANESWVYLRVKTDSDGFPKDGEVTVEAFDEAQESIHHIRLSPESDEEEGDYFFLILKTKADESDPPRPIAERRITGNREMPNQLIEILNLGEEGEAGRQEVYKGYDVALDKHDVRAVLQQQTLGVPIIEPLDPGKDAVPPKLNEEGVVITPGEPAIPPEKPGDYIRWRTIADRSSEGSDGNPQVIVEEMESDQEDETGRKRKFVKVRGNAVNEAHSDVGLFDINVVDGLVTLFAPKVQTGKNLNLSIYYLDVSSLISGGTWTWAPSLKQKLYWRNGLYVGNANPDVGGIPPAGLVEQDLFELTP
jgi:hypothetical protein